MNKVTDSSTLVDLAAAVGELGDIQVRGPGYGRADDYCQRILRVRYGRRLEYVTYDGEVLRIDHRFTAVRQGAGFVSSAGMGWQGGEPIVTMGDWQRIMAASTASFMRMSVVRERV